MSPLFIILLGLTMTSFSEKCLPISNTYRKVANSSLSQLVAPFQIFRRLMKGKFDAYVLWPLAKKFQNWIVDQSSARDFTVFGSCFERWWCFKTGQASNLETILVKKGVRSVWLKDYLSLCKINWLISMSFIYFHHFINSDHKFFLNMP